MKRLFWVLVLLVAGGILGYWWGHSSSPSIDPSASTAIRLSTNYQYVSPLLLCSTSGGNSTRDTDFQDSLKDAIAEFPQGGKVQTSVYYRDLVTGVWLGLDENQKYSPSSMLKVPIAIAYFKAAATIPGLFDQEFEIGDSGVDYNDMEYFKASESVQVGQRYSIEDLTHLMLRYSDNNSKRILDQMLVPDAKEEVYNDLGLTFPMGVVNDPDFMTVQEYARFFRVLFNATYLSSDDSEKLLSWLSEARFSYGLAAVLPSSVTIAEKFGENTVPEDGVNYNELHDCGIVYYPEHPYLICVMTKGAVPFEDLSAVIQSISDFVYKKTDADYGGE